MSRINEQLVIVDFTTRVRARKLFAMLWADEEPTHYTILPDRAYKTYLDRDMVDSYRAAAEVLEKLL